MLSGTVVGDRYQIEKEVGRGARGVIFKASDSGRSVAVKILVDDMLNDETAFDRFTTEAKTALSLKHPNIIDVFDFGLTDDGQAFLVMDYCDGCTLQQVLDVEKRLNLPRALNIFLQIVNALCYAHSKGMIHRDIKPENIVLQNDAKVDQVKVVDFGIAKKFSLLPGVDLASEGQALGTPGYMSPEQAMGERHIDARSDIYSLGCLMYTTLAGVLPIDGSSAEEILSRHISVEPVPLSLACPGALLPANVQEVVMRAIKKFPEERYQTAEQLKSDIKMLIAQLT